MYFLYFLLAGRSACLCCLAQSAEKYLIPTIEKRNTEIEETCLKGIVILQETKIKQQVIIFYYIKIKWKHKIKN